MTEEMPVYEINRKTSDELDRAKCIGGSDIAAVMGLSRWKTALRLWSEKVGEVAEEDLSNIEAVELGTELEDFVAKKFEKKTGKKVRRDSRTFKHVHYEYMVAHIDRRIVGTDELLECKTCSAWKAKEWEGEDIPQEYILQVMWYLGILGMSKGYIACLIGGQKFVWKEITFDTHLFFKMVETAEYFWENFILQKIPPMAVADDNSFLVELYPQKNEELIEASDDMNTAISHRQELAMHISEMEAQKESIEAKIKQVIGENLGLKTDKFTVTWKRQNGRITADTDKLKEDGLFEKYSKQGKETRVLRINKNKEINNG